MGIADLTMDADLMWNLAAEHDRRIPLAGTLNLRDVGGYPVAGGGSIGWRRLLRSDALHRIDQAGVDMLCGLGLRTVLDLRTAAEIEIAPSPLERLAERGTRTTHISLIGEDLAALSTELDDIYEFIVDRRGTVIGAAVRSLTRPYALPALVHCSAGKDRTGIVVALVLAAVGVPDEFIAADYALTSVYLDPRHTAAIGQVRASSGMGERLTTALLASPPELIAGVLARARQHGGTVEGYLAGQGVTADDLATLRAALVTDRDGAQDGQRESG
jgi:protein-tyrosine phosphatase